MNDRVYPVVARCLRFKLLGAVLLATVAGAFPVLAHIGVSEEIEAVTARLEDDPQAAELYLLRGNLHRINGHWSEAIADFNKVRQLDRSNALAPLGMGRTWLDRGQYSKAVRHLNRAIALQPDNVRALSARAKAFRLLGKPLSAAEDYASAIATFTEPADPLPDHYFERARALEAAGYNYLDAAIQTLDAGTDRLGSLRILEDYAVELERKRGDYAAAVLRLNRIIDRAARKESLLARRAEILEEAGDPAAAEADLATARAAIDALPAQRRHSRAMKQLRSDIERRMRAAPQSGGGE